MDYARNLDELEPDDVADKALGALLRHVANLTLGWRVDLMCIADLRTRTDVYELVRDMTVFAQRGLPVGEWTTPDDVERALLRLTHELYSSACVRGSLDIDIIDTTRAEGQYDYLHLALVGALARWRLLVFEEVTSRGLNVLAGLLGETWPTLRYPDDLEDEDEGDEFAWTRPEPPPHGTYVSHEEALAWMIEHRIPGPWEDVAEEARRLYGDDA